MQDLPQEVPQDEKFKQAAEEWERASSALEGKYGEESIPQSEWSDLIRNHITAHLQPIEKLANESGSEYGQVYDKDEVKAIFGGDEVPLPSSDVWNQIHIR